MTFLRFASVATAVAFLAAARRLRRRTRPIRKAAGGDKSELYQQLNLFGDVLERIRRDYVEPVEEKTARSRTPSTAC